jgi:hypothetical protein
MNPWRFDRIKRSPMNASFALEVGFWQYRIEAPTTSRAIPIYAAIYASTTPSSLHLVHHRRRHHRLPIAKPSISRADLPVLKHLKPLGL